MQGVLGSWKEIANYLGKGVRTVQRWERCAGLPIHRPSGSNKGVVIAFPAELDNWARRQDVHDHSQVRSRVHQNTALSHELVNHTRQLLDSTRELVKNTNLFMEIARRRSESPRPESGSFPLRNRKAQNPGTDGSPKAE